MPYQLLRLADENGIIIEYHKFQNPQIEAMYIALPDCPPVIGLSTDLCTNIAHFRTVLAHELGHHFTTAKSTIGTFLHYRNRIEASREEYRAMRWAVNYLIPTDQLLLALKKGYQIWELAEYFNVDTELVKLKLELTNNLIYKEVS